MPLLLVRVVSLGVGHGDADLRRRREPEIVFAFVDFAKPDAVLQQKEKQSVLLQCYC